MKKLLTLVLVLGFTANLIAQAKEKEKEETCLEAYQKAFAERGSKPVPDATYKNVIISIVSNKNGTECFAGKVKVEETRVTAMYIAYEDNTYEFIDRKYKGDNKAKINNGISEPFVTDQGEKIYVIFTEMIKPKKKQFKKITGPDKNF
jgi:hypothetical protein